MMALVALFATSCEKAGDDKGGKGSQPTFDIRVSENTLGVAVGVVIYPADYNRYYYYDSVPASDLDTYYQGDLNKYVLDLMDYYATYAAQYQMDFDAFMIEMGLADTGRATGTLMAEPDSENFIFAFHFDEVGNVTSEIVSISVVTPAAEMNLRPANLEIDAAYYLGYPYTLKATGETITTATGYMLEFYAMSDEAPVLELIDLFLLTDPESTDFVGTFDFAEVMDIEDIKPGVAPVGDNYWLTSNDGETVYNSMDFTDGSVTITKADNVYTVAINATDDFGRNLQYTYTGEIEIVDKSKPEASTASMSRMAKKTLRKYSSAAKMQQPKVFSRK